MHLRLLAAGQDRARCPERPPDLFLGAAGPAEVLPGLLHRDGQIVLAAITSGGSTRWALRDPVASDLPPHLDVIQNREMRSIRREPDPALRLDRLIGWQVGYEIFQLLFSDPAKTPKVRHLRGQV